MDSSNYFTLTSADLPGQITDKQLGNAFGCDGQNISPQLSWKNAPKETKAFAVSMYDLGGFWHWISYNIPKDCTDLDAGAGIATEKKLPHGAKNGYNDARIAGYLGPCPQPNSQHTYMITVHALKQAIEIEADASAALINFVLNANSLAKASLIAYANA